MKKSVLILMCAATLTACKKNETTTTESNTDSSQMSMPADTAMTVDSATVSGTTDQAGSVSEQDRTFAMEAAVSGMAEVMHGELATTSAMNAKAKALGEMMVRDHRMANDELKSWASTAGITLPASLDATHQKMQDDLKAKKGAAFDKAYTEMMVADHQKAIDLFKKQSNEGTDAALKAFATKTIPTLEQHLVHSKEARDAVK